MSERSRPWLAAGALVGLLVAALAPSDAAAGPGDLLVLADRAHVGDGRVVAPAAVLIRHGRIIAVGPAAADVAGVPVLDARGHVLVPGFVDARSGAGLLMNANEEAAETTPALRALDFVEASDPRFEKALAGGVTTVVLSPGGRAVVGGLAGVVKTDRVRTLAERTVQAEAALVITLGAEPSLGNRPPRYGTPRGIHYRRPTTRMGVLAELRSLAADVRLRRAGPEALPFARAMGGSLRTLITARTQGDILSALRLSDEMGFRPVVVGAVEGHRVAEALAAADVPVILGPFYQAPRDRIEYWEGEDLRHANAGILHEAGVTVALGTGPDDPPGSLRDLAILAARHGLPADAALAAITSVPARLLGVQARVGRIAPALDGDLLIFDGPPLDLTSRLLAVVVEGRVLVRDAALPLTMPSAESSAPSRAAAGVLP